MIPTPLNAALVYFVILQFTMMNVLIMVILNAIQDAIAQINFVIITNDVSATLLQIAVGL